MAYFDLVMSRHIDVDATKLYFWDNENPNSPRDGRSWATAWRDGEGVAGTGEFAFVRATNTPYRMDLNKSGMSNDSIFCDCTGVGFERGSKKADFRASKTFAFTQSETNIYSASVADILTGERTGAYAMDYPGHYIFAETLNYDGAWGVWRVTGYGDTEVVTPLTRVLNYIQMTHGTWCWADGTMYICWDGPFVSNEFEVVQRAKAFELWTDSLPADGKRSRMSGIRSRFGLFGHHNAACNGWQLTDSEMAWNAIDGVAIIAENTLAKSHSLYTQIYRCHIHHNFRDGITNYVTPAGAAGRGNGGWFDVNVDFNYIHDNGGAGVFIHRPLRWNVLSDVQSAEYPFYIGNNTIINNGRGVVFTDERMNDVIHSFGYDQMAPSEWESKTYQQKVDHWNSLYSQYDTSYAKLRNNNISGNGVDTELTTDTWPGTTFVIDSDYNNIFPSYPAWNEGEHSKSVDPGFTDTPKISGQSGLYGFGVSPRAYPKNSETSLFYYTTESSPYDLDSVGVVYNIGAAGNGPVIVDLVISRHMPSASVETKVFQVPEGPEYAIVVDGSISIKTAIPFVHPEDTLVVGRGITISTEVYDTDPEIYFDSDSKDMFILVSGVWRRVLLVSVLVEGVWREASEISVLNSGVWNHVVY